MKKRLLIILSIVAALALVGGLFLIFNPFGQNPEPTPTTPSTSQPRQVTDQIITEATQKVLDTEEFTTSSAKYSQFLDNQTDITSPFPPALVLFAANTAGTYVDNAYLNPYFVSGYWDAKDDLSDAALKKFLYPSVTDELQSTLTEATTLEEPDAYTRFSPYVFMPTPGAVIPEDCAENWNNCFFLDPQIQSIKVVGTTGTEANVQVVFTTQTFFQAPEFNEGIYSVENRKYVVDMVVENTNPYFENFAATDIKVKSLTTSLDITVENPPSE